MTQGRIELILEPELVKLNYELYGFPEESTENTGYVSGIEITKKDSSDHPVYPVIQIARYAAWRYEIQDGKVDLRKIEYASDNTIIPDLKKIKEELS